MNTTNGTWEPVRKKKPTVSWLGAGVRAKTIKAVGNNIEARKKLTNDENESYRMRELKSNTQRQQQDKFEASLPYLELNMFSKSLVLVLVQDNNSGINLPGGSVPNRLAPPMPVSKCK